MRVVKLGLRALNKVGLLRHLTFNVPMAPSGKWTWIPMIKGVGFTYVLEFEPFMDALIGRLVPLFPGTFVDVGVNIGQTLIKLKSAWPDQPYLGIEPNPVCVQYAERLIRVNGFKHARIIPVALTDHDGDGSLVLWHGQSKDDPTATIVRNFRTDSTDQREIKVQFASWARIQERVDTGKLGFVKIDVEGAELEVLQTMQERIRMDRPIVALEVLPTYDPPLPDRVERQVGIEHMAAMCELQIFRIHKQDHGLRLEALEQFGVFSDLSTTDHLLVPKERVNEVLAALNM
jgi:FkbM family methyltransferase